MKRLLSIKNILFAFLGKTISILGGLDDALMTMTKNHDEYYDDDDDGDDPDDKKKGSFWNF